MESIGPQPGVINAKLSLKPANILPLDDGNHSSDQQRMKRLIFFIFGSTVLLATAHASVEIEVNAKVLQVEKANFIVEIDEKKKCRIHREPGTEFLSESKYSAKRRKLHLPLISIDTCVGRSQKIF